MAKELAEGEYDNYRRQEIEVEDAKIIKELEEGLKKLKTEKNDVKQKK